MRKNMMWFLFGAIVATIGTATLSAYEVGRYWKDSEIRQVIRLLETIAENTAR